MNLAEALANLRGIERSARERLKEGCIQDRSIVEDLVDRLLERAREELETRLLALGSLDSTLRRSLFIQEAAEVEHSCVREAFANVDIRFRARYAFYVAAVNDAEHEFLELARQIPEAPPVRQERRVAMPHLDSTDEAVPLCAFDLVSSSDLAEWSASFRSRLIQALLEAERTAREALIHRAHASLARTQLALHRALSHSLVQ